MHQLNVLILGSNSFISTLIELKPFLKFNLIDKKMSLASQIKSFDGLIFHSDFISSKKDQDVIDKYNCIKILASNKKQKNIVCEGFLKLPATLNEINFVVENLAAKKLFNANSSIQIKGYQLDKNEKKLFKNEKFIILTEKEIQLLNLLLNSKKKLPKNEILSKVWNYSSEADTHTVETHIYRLRKKINEKFNDEDFLLNNKDGYYL